jgi:uncharacterized membrane protein YphA (DoxX/SURF4 family)
MLQINKNYSVIILRIGLVIVYLWFGINQLIDPQRFVGWLPNEASLIPTDPINLILLNGIFEILLSLAILFGIYIRYASWLLSLHLFAIAYTIGLNETGIRDIGLAFATLALGFSEPDKYTLDKKLENKLG